MEYQLIEEFESYFQGIIRLGPRLIAAILVFAIFYGLGYGIRWLIRRRIMARKKQGIVIQFIAELVFWGAILFGIFSALQALGFSNIANSLMAGAGLSAIIFGFAFKDILENFLAGILLTFQKPFQQGDIIQIGEFKGPVRALELRSTHIRLADGRDIWIPNAMLVKSVLTNFTRDGLFRHEFMLHLSYNDNTEAARHLILDWMATQKSILKNPSANVVIEELQPSGVKMKVMFWINQMERINKADPISRGETIKSQMMRGVSELLIKHRFGLDSPTTIEHTMKKKGDSLRIELTQASDVKTPDGNQSAQPN